MLLGDLLRCLILVPVFALVGCGGGSSSGAPPPPPPARFTLSLNPNQLDLFQSSTQTVQVQVAPQNGFSGSVTVTETGLPSGVSASPSSLTVSVSSPGTLALTSASNATAGNAQLTINGVSGSLQASATLGLDVIQMATPIEVPFTTTGGNVMKAFYDESRQLLFATNLGLNEVDVLAGSNLAVRARIPIGQPFGIDQMPDGNTLVVGTFTQGFYTINENTLAVTHYLAPNFTQLLSTVVLLVPVAMANGKVLFLGKDIGVGGVDIYIYGAQAIIEWDSSTGQFSMPYYVPYDSLWIQDLKRSADYNWAVYSADKLYIYSSASDSFVSSVDPVNSAPFGVRDVAANPNGSQFAVVSAYSVSFYDQAFNPLGSVNLGSNAGLVFQNNNSQYSADGSRLYWEMFGDQGGGSVVDVLDAVNFVQMGNIGSNFDIQTQFPPGLLWVDSTQQAFFSAGSGGSGEVSGVGELSVSTLRSGMPDLAGGVGPNPFVIPLNQSTAVTLNAANSILPIGTSVTIGGVLAPQVSSNPWAVQVPASSVAGPVNVGVTQPDGETLVQPLDFVYGVDVASATSNLVPPIGNPTLALYGYGILNPGGSVPTAPTVTVGGLPVTNLAVNLNADYILQGLYLQLPNGTPGPADIVVSANNGTGTLKAGITYIPSATIVPASGLLQLLYDTHRSLLYALQNTQVQVFDPVSLAWKNPLIPVGGVGYVWMALTPDGSKLVALDSKANTLTVFNPDNPSQSTITQLPSLSAMPTNVAVTSTDKAFIGGTDPNIEFDLATNTYKLLPNSANGVLGQFMATPDGTHMAAVAEDTSSGGLAVWNSSNDSLTFQGLWGAFWTDLAISSDGSVIAPVEGNLSYAGVAVGFFDSELHFLNANVYPGLAPPDEPPAQGALFSNSGQTLLTPLADSIDFFNMQTGTLSSRLLMPELLPVGNTYAGVIELDPNQQTIYAISASGLTVVTLPSTVDQLTPFPWPYVARPHSVLPGGSTQPRALDALRAQREKVRPKTLTDGVGRGPFK